MTNVENGLAARKIADMLVAGYSKEAAIAQSARLVEAQGFSAEYASEVAKQMAELL